MEVINFFLLVSVSFYKKQAIHSHGLNCIKCDYRVYCWGGNRLTHGPCKDCSIIWSDPAKVTIGRTSNSITLQQANFKVDNFMWNTSVINIQWPFAAKRFATLVSLKSPSTSCPCSFIQLLTDNQCYQFIFIVIGCVYTRNMRPPFSHIIIVLLYVNGKYCVLWFHLSPVNHASEILSEKCRNNS